MKGGSGHAYIAATIFFTVHSQLVIRWQVGRAGPLLQGTRDKVQFILSLLINPWVVTALISTFLAGVSSMLAMSKVQLSYAYPFISLNFLLMLVAGVLFFHESFTLSKAVGTVLIVSGIVVLALAQGR
jgi:multidrug transporter EmrE-like cation transporter